MEPVISELTRWSGSLTRLASDLVRCTKSMCVRYIYRQLTTLAPTNEEASWLDEEKKLIAKKIACRMSACDVTRVVTLVTYNLSVRVFESGE
jgi:hypothetical protein